MKNEPDITNVDLPPTQFEIDEQRHRATLALNELRERRRLTAANRAAGFPAPKPGDTLYVSISDRNIPQRTRAGVRFEGRGARSTVQVVDLSDQDVANEQQAGRQVVNVWGAERILADDALTVNQRAGDPEELEALRRRIAELEAQAAEDDRRERAEAKSLRDARRNAPESSDGRPSRLIAQQEARAKLDDKPDGKEVFGAEAQTPEKGKR